MKHTFYEKSKMPRLLILAVFFIMLFKGSTAWGYGQPLNLTPAEKQALDDAKGHVPGEVVFSSLRDGKWRLFRIDADGTNLSRLSLGPANYTAPRFIHAGQHLIYHSDENGLSQIFMSAPDMKNPVLLSPLEQEERFAGMAYNNLMLVYRPAVYSHFLRPLSKGPEIRLLLPEALSKIEHKLTLELAPSGRRIVATSYAEDNQPGTMFLLNLNPLTGHTSLQRELGKGDYVSWRGDSEALVFVHAANSAMTPGTAIWFWEEGGHSQQLSDDSSWNIDTGFALNGPGLVWSKAPLFTRDPASGRYDIWLQRENGLTLRLTQHTAPDRHPTWRPQTGAPQHQGVDFIYDARAASTFRGIALPDPDSPGRRSLESAPNVEVGLLLNTEPEVVPPGWYQARFRIKLPDAASLPPSLPVARLEVAYHSGQKVVAESTLLAGNFTGPGYNLFPLQFKLDQLIMGLELRLYTMQPNVSLRCDVLFLQSDAPAPWYAPVLELWRKWTE